MTSQLMPLSAVVLSGALLLIGSGGGGGGSDEISCATLEVPELLGPGLGLTADMLELDPFGTAPLSARLSTSIPLDGTFTITVEGMPGGSGDPDGVDILGSVDRLAGEVGVPVLGLYPDYMNTVVVAFEACNGQTTTDSLSIRTAPLPATGNGQVALPVTVEVLTDDLPDGDQGLYLFSQQKSAFDRTGAVRWTYLGEGWQFYRQLPNGHWLGNINTDQVVYHFGDFAEFSMLGETVSRYRVDNYLHHDVQKLPWGNYLVASNSTPIDFADNGVPEEDVLYEYDAETGQVVHTCDINQILDPTRTPIPSNSRPDDWLHNNAVYYDPVDDTIVITAQRQSLFAKIRYECDSADDLLWILGAHEEWPVSFQDRLLQPVDAQGNPLDPNTLDFWPYGPHAGVVNGTDGSGNVRLLGFDNGAFRGWYADDQVAGTSYSRGIEYAIDETAMTVRISWQYHAGQQIATDFTGDVDPLPNGNILIGFAWTNDPQNPSEAPRVVELQRDNTIVFEAVANRGESEYRVEKIDLYAGQ